MQRNAEGKGDEAMSKIQVSKLPANIAAFIEAHKGGLRLDWSDLEKEIVREGKRNKLTAAKIQQALTMAGFNRTITAVHSKVLSCT